MNDNSKQDLTSLENSSEESTLCGCLYIACWPFMVALVSLLAALSIITYDVSNWLGKTIICLFNIFIAYVFFQIGWQFIKDIIKQISEITLGEIQDFFKEKFHK